MREIPIHYEPAKTEKKIYQKWLDSGSMRAIPDERENRYVVMMPLPNVTGALHMGHAMDNVMQDLLIRWHRMKGDNTLWMPGTDHAGIATQAVVEKRLLELEGKTRKDIGREALVEKIWAWKDEYEARIIKQQQAMGCSCDWDLHRFTMDPVCARAVREAFFRFFQDGLLDDVDEERDGPAPECDQTADQRECEKAAKRKATAAFLLLALGVPLNTALHHSLGRGRGALARRCIRIIGCIGFIG